MTGRAFSINNHDHSYVHIQGITSNEWLVVHNLNRKPSVTVVDSGNTVVFGHVQYLDNNKLIIRFNASFNGRAYLN